MAALAGSISNHDHPEKRANMLEHFNGTLSDPVAQEPQPVHEEAVQHNAATPEIPVQPELPADAAEGQATSSHHAAAGRKGAERVHQLIERGRLYEQEHGLKRGRQRLRQLLAEGKMYEQEHGLSQGRGFGRRPARPSQDQLLKTLLETLLRLVKPSHRMRLLELLQTLEPPQEARQAS
jgi:hypothetical protein